MIIFYNIIIGLLYWITLIMIQSEIILVNIVSVKTYDDLKPEFFAYIEYDIFSNASRDRAET